MRKLTATCSPGYYRDLRRIFEEPQLEFAKMNMTQVAENLYISHFYNITRFYN